MIVWQSWSEVGWRDGESPGAILGRSHYGWVVAISWAADLARERLTAWQTRAWRRAAEFEWQLGQLRVGCELEVSWAPEV